ncbi:MAG: hypothetical protein UY21_C0003G0016 [Microgenomates group bacterium GW2011_GWA1_48_10]|nr:MAG: hypothetical protein UY21_C0003G0016 [Microgenomates group bacterium GW2011_GWA1_48_10]
MLQIEFRDSYRVDLEELLTEDGDMSDLVEEATKLFRKNPDDTRLDSHPLRRR